MSASAANWSESSVTFLRGSNFSEVFGTDNNRSELTLDNASSLKYGDSFFWLDVTDFQSNSGSSDTELYGEWSPRLSFGKIFDMHNKERFVQDILIATTLEFGNSGKPTRSRLYGLGLDLKIPHFTFFQYNFYIRDNLDKTGTTFQSTLAYKILWKPQFIMDNLIISYAAYIDIIHGDEGTESDSTLAEAHWHTGQQLTVDLGALINSKYRNSFYTGFEYQYWNRKYGLKDGPVENNLKWMLRWVL